MQYGNNKLSNKMIGVVSAVKASKTIQTIIINSTKGLSRLLEALRYNSKLLTKKNSTVLATRALVKYVQVIKIQKVKVG